VQLDKRHRCCVALGYISPFKEIHCPERVSLELTLWNRIRVAPFLILGRYICYYNWIFTRFSSSNGVVLRAASKNSTEKQIVMNVRIYC
jgi:hypothetical protein